MEKSSEKEKQVKNVKINKKYNRVISLINKISISNYHFSKKELFNKVIKNKSYDFISKKIPIDNNDISNIIKRKYTKENISLIKRFVPKIKPIKNTIMPSKLFLNKKNNKKVINTNQTYLSCPNSEDEKVFDSSKESFPLCSTKIYNNNNRIKVENIENQDINNARKNLVKTKKINRQKSSSANSSLIIPKFENNFYLDNSYGSDLGDEEYDNYILLRKDLTSKKENVNNRFRNRTNSMSILELLEKKFKVDD